MYSVLNLHVILAPLRSSIFNKNKFDRLDSVYNLELEIKVGRGLGEKK